MRTMLLTAGLVLVAAAGAAQAAPENLIAASNARAQAALAADPTLRYDPGSILVRFRGDAEAAQRDAAVSTALALIDAEVIQTYRIVPGLVHMTVGVGADEAIEFLQATGLVEYAEPDYFVHTQNTPNDPGYAQCWGLHNTGQSVNGDPGTNDADIDGPEAWSIFTGNPNFVVAVIDTGVQRSHPDLAANMWTNPGEIASNGIDDDGNGYIDDVNGWDFYNNDNDPNDDNGHGTHCAGTIGAVGNNGIGVVGVVWRAKMVGLKFLGSSGSGSISAALSALQYCTLEGIKVSSNSWGGGGYSQSFFNAIEASKSVGHLFVAAAGNGGYNNDTTPSYPASYTNDNVIAVAATDNDDRRASFSQYGATSVDLGAPGVNVYSTYIGSSYRYLSGTSMATPHVSGVVAAIYGQNSNWTYSQVRSRLLSTTRPVSALSGRCVTGGVANLRNAIIDNNNATVVTNSTANNQTVVGGTMILYAATASDVQDGNVSASIVWTSSLQGQFAAGPSVNFGQLMIGTHTVTATATDSNFASGSASITITVTPNGGALPASPFNMRAYRVAPLTLDLTWGDGSTNEFGFEIERQTRVGLNWINTTTVRRTPANTTSSREGVPASGTYRFRVRPFNGAGYGPWSAYATVSL